MVFRSLQYALTKIAQKTERPVNASRDGIFSVTENKTQRKSRPQGRIFAGVPSNVLLLLLVISSALMPSHVAATTSTAVDTKASSITEQPRQFNIPRQRADGALTAFGQQADLTVVYQYDRIKNYHTNQLQGDYKVTHAVAILLANTGLSAEFDAARYLIITDQSKGKKMNTANSSKRKTVLAGLVGLFAAGGMTQAVAQGGEAATGQSAIDEIIVTATKRETSLQDTALSISAITNEAIDKRDLVSMEDYLGGVPGVSMVDRGVGRNSVIIRGVTADPTFGDPTSGVYFGDTPVTGLSFFGGNADIKLVDMERVEILRGPQGTLYGSSSLAGTVRNIPEKPDLDNMSGKFKVGFSNTAKEGGNNTNIVGTINVPIVEGSLALRASAYSISNSGYIKNVAGDDPILTTKASDFGAPELAINEDDIGSNDYVGGRVQIRWEATESLNINLTHLTQNLEQDGIPEVELQFDTYEQSRLQLSDLSPRSDEGLIDDINLTNLVINYDLGWGSLTSSSSWFEEDSERHVGLTVFTPFPYSQYGVRDVDMFVEEVRLVSQLDGSLNFVLGLYYEDIENNLAAENLYVGAQSLHPVDPLADRSLFQLAVNTEVEQKALFGELTYQFTESLALTLGARFFDYDKKENDLVSKKSDQSGKVNLAYSPTDDMLLYAQWSEGFRLGKPQAPQDPSICDIDGNGLIDGTSLSIDTNSTDPDFLESFELGAKLTGLNGRLTMNGSIYHNEWQGLPVLVLGAGVCQSFANAGEAETEGVEFEANFFVTENVKLNFGGSYSEAELTEDVVSLNAVSGDRLPGSPRFNGNIGVEYSFTLTEHNAFVRADYDWRGGFYSDLQEATPETGDYGLLNLKLGVQLESVFVELYAKNVTGEDDLSYWNTAFFGVGSRLRPRTFGANLSYKF